MSVNTIKHRKTEPVIKSEEKPANILINVETDPAIIDPVIIEAEPSDVIPTDMYAIEGEMNGT